jgi:hypothetical protein
MEIPEEAFTELINELERRPLEKNKYRTVAGEGRSQAFGLVNRRCLPADYSRQCWKRPYLYKLLLDIADKYVTIPYTSITVNQNYKADAHRDKNNIGDSVLVSFGKFTGGELKMHEGELEGLHDIRHKPLQANFSIVTHSVEPWEGDRYSLVFYCLKAHLPNDFPKPSVVYEDDKWVFKRGGEVCTGLPHPLSKPKN